MALRGFGKKRQIVWRLVLIAVASLAAHELSSMLLTGLDVFQRRI
jgi:hypothetical protein